MFSRRKKFIHVWNNLRVGKLWRFFMFGWTRSSRYSLWSYLCSCMKLWPSINYKHIKNEMRAFGYLLLPSMLMASCRPLPEPHLRERGTGVMILVCRTAVAHADIETLRQSHIYINCSNIINKSRKKGTLQ